MLHKRLADPMGIGVVQPFVFHQTVGRWRRFAPAWPPVQIQLSLAGASQAVKRMRLVGIVTQALRLDFLRERERFSGFSGLSPSFPVRVGGSI